jgi:hypothetical protein
VRRDSGASDGPLAPLADSLLAAGSDSDDDSALRVASSFLGPSTPSKTGAAASAAALPDGPLSAGGGLGASKRLLLSPLSMGGPGGGLTTPTMTLRVGVPVEDCELRPFVRARLPLAVAMTATPSGFGPPGSLERHNSFTVASGGGPSAEAIAASVVTEADARLEFRWWALRRVAGAAAPAGASGASGSSSSSSGSADVTDEDGPVFSHGGSGSYRVPCAYSCCAGSVPASDGGCGDDGVYIAPPPSAATASGGDGSKGGAAATGSPQSSPVKNAWKARSAAAAAAAAAAAVAASAFSSSYRAGIAPGILSGGLDGWAWDGVGKDAPASVLRVWDSWAASQAAAETGGSAGTVDDSSLPSRTSSGPLVTVGGSGAMLARSVSAPLPGGSGSVSLPPSGPGFHFNCAICDGTAGSAAGGAAHAAAGAAHQPTLAATLPSPVGDAAAPGSPGKDAPAPSPRPFAFCSLRCLVSGWREHAQYHALAVDVNNGTGGSGSGGSGGDKLLAAATAAAGGDDPSGCPPGHAWVLVSASPTYAPQAVDVGRPLRLTVTLPQPAPAATPAAGVSSGSSSDADAGILLTVGKVGRALDFTGGGSAAAGGGPAPSPTGSGGPALPPLVQTVVTCPVRPFPPAPPPRTWVALTPAQAQLPPAAAAAAPAPAPAPAPEPARPSAPPGLRPPPGLPIPAAAQQAQAAAAAAAAAASSPSPAAAAVPPTLAQFALPAGAVPLRVLCWNVLADVYATGKWGGNDCGGGASKAARVRPRVL